MIKTATSITIVATFNEQNDLWTATVVEFPGITVQAHTKEDAQDKAKRSYRNRVSERYRKFVTVEKDCQDIDVISAEIPDFAL